MKVLDWSRGGDIFEVGRVQRKFLLMCTTNDYAIVVPAVCNGKEFYGMHAIKIPIPSPILKKKIGKNMKAFESIRSYVSRTLLD